MSNLSLGNDARQLGVFSGYIARNFPGALPYVVYRGQERAGEYASVAEVLPHIERSGWSRDTRKLPYARWILEDGAYSVEFGREDWDDAGERVVLVGELNPYQDKADFDLYDLPDRASGHRLRTLVLGVSRENYFRRFVRRNLCVEKWSAPAARKRASELAQEFPTRVFVLLGKKVQDAFGLYVAASFEAIVHPERAVVCLPHPSGLCRAWREPGSFDRARKTIIQCAPHLVGILGEG